MAAGSNTGTPNPNPTPGAWTVTAVTGGLMFLATGGDATSNGNCFLSMQVTVTCDATVTTGFSDLTYTPATGCTSANPNSPFTFTAKSAAACPAAPSPPPAPTPSGDGGTVVVEVHSTSTAGGIAVTCIIFVGGALYFIVGCIIKAARGARGAEAIPNVDFWKSFPGLVRDGFLFVFTCGKRTSYGSIP
jgi:hypothetical protein